MRDSFDRDIDNESAYNSAEHAYIYQNMRPDHISVWEWRVMFDEITIHKHKALAIADAKLMARDMGYTTIVQKWFGGYRALPSDHEVQITKWARKYSFKKLEFIKWLVVNDKYPDIVKIIEEDKRYQFFPNGDAGSHYFYKVKDLHKYWKEEANLHNQNPSEPSSDSMSL